ncbi:TetR/AcrR family transcriptional regulator [Acinetobacter thermotolerans]|uniref:TetR/AcrR family transcriptional regulator n=1 Tax=Acinetobacter thermotolerans TaxID=3151487 RepID=UPI00325A8CFD
MSALYLAALKDQSSRRLEALSQVQGIEQGIHAIIQSYIDWVVSYPDFARFLYAAHHSVQTGGHYHTLEQSNSERNQDLKAWLVKQPDAERLKAIPTALLMSLVIGPTESYCCAWLSGRVKDSPQQYIQALAQSAWDSLQHFSKI